MHREDAGWTKLAGEPYMELEGGRGRTNSRGVLIDPSSMQHPFLRWQLRPAAIAGPTCVELAAVRSVEQKMRSKTTITTTTAVAVVLSAMTLSKCKW